MLNLGLVRRLFGVGVAVIALAGCVGSQSGVGVMAQGVTATSQRGDGRSWMSPGAKNNDLLYIGSSAGGDVYVYTYPAGKLVGRLTGFDNPLGLCSDTTGNLWITNAVSNGKTYLLEYAHGGTKAIAKLDDSGFEPLACSIDPATGDLAVGNSIDDLAVWKNARGKPRHYLTSCCVFAPQSITFDSSGDTIFADFRTRSGWLRKGDSTAMGFVLMPHLQTHGSFDWDGKHLAVLAFSRKLRQEEVIRYKVSGGTANQVGTVPLDGITTATNGQFWIQDSGMVLADSDGGDVYFFSYPKGGHPTKTISGLDDPFGVTVSVSPSRSRIRR
jgi:hypothetical protein